MAHRRKGEVEFAYVVDSGFDEDASDLPVRCEDEFRGCARFFWVVDNVDEACFAASAPQHLALEDAGVADAVRGSIEDATVLASSPCGVGIP